MSKKFGAGVFALLLVVFCAGTAAAQDAAKPAGQPTPATATQDEQDDADREDPCPGSHTQFELNQCAARARDRADAELNKVYRQLVSRLGDKKWEMKLRAAQQAWIKYRDANCDYESEFSGGGSAATFEYNFCLAEITTARAKELQKMYDKIKARDGE